MPNQSQSQDQSGNTQDQTQRKNDKDSMPIDREPGPLGKDRLPEADAARDRGVEGSKPTRKPDDKTGTERDPARISPQDDLA